MGIMSPYFPTEMAMKLAEVAKADTFIETGTYTGGTTKWASTQFREVHTIELSELLYNQIKDELLAKGNITPHFGDSRDILPKILANIQTNVVFWLDGHYSSGVTAGKDDPCPLLKELEIILKRNNDDIILIDDARCLLAENGWPTIFELYKKIAACAVQPKYMIVCDDNIYIVPDTDNYKELLLTYTLERSAILWNQDNGIRNPYNPKRAQRDKRRAAIMQLLKNVGLYKLARSIYRSVKRK
jgi:hypothetical protein